MGMKPEDAMRKAIGASKKYTDKSIAGAGGLQGESAYEIAVDNGFVGTESEWLASLKGADGTDGTDGADGKSAYEVAVEEGYSGTEQEWLASLKGADGTDGSDGVSVTGVAKSSSVGLVDTYVMGFSNGDSFSYQVTNGKDGSDGTLGGLSDVTLQSVTDESVLMYDSSDSEWKNAELATVAISGEYGDLLFAPENPVQSISVNGVAQTVGEEGAVNLNVADNLITETQWSHITGLYE